MVRDGEAEGGILEPLSETLLAVAQRLLGELALGGVAGAAPIPCKNTVFVKNRNAAGPPVSGSAVGRLDEVFEVPEGQMAFQFPSMTAPAIVLVGGGPGQLPAGFTEGLFAGHDGLPELIQAEARKTQLFVHFPKFVRRGRGEVPQLVLRVDECLLGPLARCDILDMAHGVQRRAIKVAEQRRPDIRLNYVPVLVQESLLIVIIVDLSREQPLIKLVTFLCVLRMGDVEPGEVKKFLFRIPKATDHRKNYVSIAG